MSMKKRVLALACAAALAIQLGVPALAADAERGQEGSNGYPSYYTEYMIKALEQGNDIQGDPYTHQDTLFTASMVHNNPGLEPYTSNYNDSQFLADRDFDEQVFFLYDCAQYGLLWDQYDRDQGIDLTEEEWETAPDTYRIENDTKVFPYGSEARAWVEAKRADLHAKYDAADEAGIDVYFMMDMIVLPTHLKQMRSDLLTSGKIDITKAATQAVMDAMFQEMFTEFPTIDGIYIRYGETYTGTKYGDAAPYHTGNNPILQGETSHMALINYMGAKLYGDKRVDSAYRDVIYRTWGFGGFQNTPSEYLRVSENVTPNDHLYFCIKHSTGDFHRDVAFNQTIGIGQHQQIVEVQCAREYEGKGAYPNYLIHGVINGMEEYEWLNPDDTYQSLRDVINSAEDPQVKGIWIWPRGGGWNGPYINGVNGIRNDNPYYPQDVEPRLSNPEVVIEDGSEMWNDLNSYVVTQWAKDTSKTDKYYVKQYAERYLGMNERDAEKFYELCILSDHAVLLGRGTNDPQVKSKCNNTWWTRDQNIAVGTLENNINGAVNNNLQAVVLEEKAQGVRLWKDMLKIAESLETTAKLIDSPTVSVKDYIITTCKYGYYFFDITQQMHIAGILKAEGKKSGVYDTVGIARAVAEYDRLWEEWEELYETAPGCPTLFEKEDRSNNLIGYSGNRGTDAFMDKYRESLTVDSSLVVAEGSAVSLPVRYTYGFDPAYFTFESSNEEIARVNENGQVTGVAQGKCMVTVTTASGLSAASMVAVLGPDAVEVTTPFQETFESADSVSNWQRTNNGGTFTWENGVAKLAGEADDGKGDYQYTLSEPLTGMLTYSMDVSVSKKENDSITLKDSGGNILIQLDFGGPKTNEKIVFNGVDGSNNVLNTNVGYKVDTVYTVTFEIDIEKGTFLTTVTEKDSGTKLLDAEAHRFRNAAANDLSVILLGSRDGAAKILGGVMTVDNILVVRKEIKGEEEVVYENNFSQDNTAEWTGSYGTISWADGEIRIANGNNGNGRSLSLGGPYTDKVTVSWRMKVNNTNQRAYVRLKDSGGKNLTQVEFRGSTVAPAGKIVVDGITGQNPQALTSQSYAADQYYDVVVDVDPKANSYTIAIGEESLSYSSFKDTGVANVAAIEVVARENNITISVDDIRVTMFSAVKFTAQEIADAITSAGLRDDVNALAMPAVPDGYTVSIKDVTPAGIVDNEGNVTLPANDTEVNVIFQVTKVSDPSDIGVTQAIPVNIPSAGHREYPVTVRVQGQGTASADVAEAPEGAVVTLTKRAAEGWHFVEWSSDDVTVDGNTFEMPAGDVTVTAVFEEDGAEYVHVTGVSLNKNRLALNVGGSAPLVATVEPENATNKDVAWSSSNEAVAQVDQNGRVTARAVGTAVITVSTLDKNFTDTCTVTVTAADSSDSDDDDDVISSGSAGNKGGTVTEPEAPSFSDVAEKDWFAEAVEYVTRKGLMNGTGENRFSPNGRGSRAMVWTILARMEGVDTTGGANWYAKGQEWAVDNEVSDGTNPDAEITREQLATMLYRYAGKPKAEGEGKTFVDSNAISAWAAEGVDWAIKTGILNGKSGDVLDPTGVVTRAELATMLMRFCENGK